MLKKHPTPRLILSLAGGMMVAKPVNDSAGRLTWSGSKNKSCRLRSRMACRTRGPWSRALRPSANIALAATVGFDKRWAVGRGLLV